MSKKQTRRSVSIRGSTYATVRDYCERNGISMSEFMEARIAGFFGTDRKQEVRQISPVLAHSFGPSNPAVLNNDIPKRAERPKRQLGTRIDDDKLTSKQLHDAARVFTF